MSNKMSVFAVALAVCFLCLTAWGQPFYVSPKGDDKNAGTADKPFKTIERAKEAVHGARATIKGDIEVFLGGGTYTMADTLCFVAEDGGTDRLHQANAVGLVVPGRRRLVKIALAHDRNSSRVPAVQWKHRPGNSW